MPPKRENKPLQGLLIDSINKEDVFFQNSHESLPYELEIRDLISSKNANQMDENEFTHAPLSQSSFQEKIHLPNTSLEPNLERGIISLQTCETIMANPNQLLRTSKIKDPKTRDFSKKIQVENDQDLGSDQDGSDSQNKGQDFGQDQRIARLRNEKLSKKSYKGFLNSKKLIVIKYFEKYHPELMGKNEKLTQFVKNTSKSTRAEFQALFFNPQLAPIVGRIFSSKFVMRESQNSSINTKNRREFLQKYKLLRRSFIEGKILNLT